MSVYSQKYQDFLIEHQKVIKSLGLGEADISPEMLNPIKNEKKYSMLDLDNFESQNHLKLHPSLKTFLTEFGSFEFYKHQVYKIDEYKNRTEAVKSWSESDTLENEETNEQLRLENLILFAGYASDGFLMDQKTGLVYSWSHDEPEFVGGEGNLEQWFDGFLKKLLKTARSYWV